MNRQLVGYYTGSPNTEMEEDAQERAGKHGYSMLLWRRDGASLRHASLDQRHRLHEALFCVRAGFADALWFPAWDHLDGHHGPTVRELVCAEVWASGGQVIVDRQIIEPEDTVPAEQRTLRELASTGTRLREAVFPRRNKPDDPDIGWRDSDWERARLAHKLSVGFQLKLDEVAEFLDSTGYVTSRGKPFTSGSVDYLLRVYAEDFWSRQSSVVQQPGRIDADDTSLIIYGPDAENLKSAAERYNASLSAPCTNVFAMPKLAGVAGDDADPSGLDTTMRQLRLLLLVASYLGGGVYVSSPDVFGSLIVRELTYAQLWQSGVTVIVDGIPVDRDSVGDPVTPALRDAARAGAGLHAALRAHDSDTITGDKTTLEEARIVAQTLYQTGSKTYARIAKELEKEAIPTSGKGARWSPSAVWNLLNGNRLGSHVTSPGNRERHS